MYKKGNSLVILIAILVLTLIGAGTYYYVSTQSQNVDLPENGATNIPKGIVAGDYNIFKGIIQEVNGDNAIVKPNANEIILQSADKISVGLMGGKYKVGEEVEVTYAGPVMESYPAQVNVLRIELVKYSQSAALYTRLIENLITEDNALNPKADEFIAIDFTNFKTVQGKALPQEDKDAIVSFLGNYHKNIKVATLEELEVQGYFDRENLILEGILIFVSKIDIKSEKNVIVDMVKYRSGLGAILPTYDAKYKNGQWTYEITSMAIS